MKNKIKMSTFVVGVLFAVLFFFIEGIGSGLLRSLLSLVMPEGAAALISSIVLIGVIYLLIFLVTTKLLKLSMEEIGIPKIRIEIRWVIVGCILTAAVCGIYFALPGQTGVVDSSISQFDRFLISVSIAAVAGINEELIFRGLFMHILKYRFNVPAAVIVQSFLFAALHLLNGNLSITGAIQLLAGATAAGCMFSMIALVKDSVWNSAIVHGIWDLFVGEIIAFANEPKGREMFYKSLNTSNPLITGGGYGIDCSVICIFCFAAVFCIAYREYRKYRKNQM